MSETRSPYPVSALQVQTAIADSLAEMQVEDAATGDTVDVRETYTYDELPVQFGSSSGVVIRLDDGSTWSLTIMPYGGELK